jgi:hypothetical protein
MIYRNTKFHMLSSDDSLLIAIKLNAKYTFRAATILLYTLQKKYLNKNCIFFEDLLPCIKFRTFKFSGASVAPTSQVPASAILLLPIVGNLEPQ